MQDRIEETYGYDVIDHKNYNDVEPEVVNALDFASSA